ncbi:MAG: cyclase family protein [Alphaproteobacteria bacterium]|nr:cyclase family protein [Alphaproteobacteria bacterium]
MLTNWRFVDLTHVLCSDAPSWNGSCGFQMEIMKDYGENSGTRFRTHSMSLEAGIGTHIDAPSHCIQGGLTIDELSLKDLIAPCVLLDVSDKSHDTFSLSSKDILDFEERHGKIEESSFIIVHTGWGRFWKNPEAYRNNYHFPCVSQEAAELLLERGIKGLGIDTLSPDRPESGYPVHQLMLSSGKYIVENVANAHLLPPKGPYTLALPIKVKEATEAPIRLVAMLPKA